MAQLLGTPTRELMKPMLVVFENEEAVDAGGPKRELHTLLTSQVFSPSFGLFVFDEEERTLWFDKNATGRARDFFFAGLLISMSIYNDIVLPLNFPLTLYNRLLGQTSMGLDDLVDVYPVQAASFQQMLQLTDKEEFDAAFGDMTFEVDVLAKDGSVTSKELKKGGKTVSLTLANRREYVKLYTNYLLVDSIYKQFTPFCSGFLSTASSLLFSFTGCELQLLIGGAPALDFQALKAAAKYEGYSSSEDYIVEFWKIVFQFDNFQKKQFLKFCTGSDRPPMFGLGEVELTIQKNGADPTNHLPTAYTCFSVLLLPHYHSVHKLKALLLLAIENAEGFGLQ
eukprot:GHVT01018938.1.p1 GENE.GHVT01018938.1~~GHVT01018938.1.p1  ORF type:complete len:392 (-),score=108.72 GHVT01018938.1:240-1256(-)